MKRRDFLKAAVGASALCGASVAEARPNLEPAPEAIGMLFDSSLCIGCKACVSACKEANHMPAVVAGDADYYDSARDLSGKTLNVIKLYKNGSGATKDAITDGFAYEKRSCMHCVDPGCVSVCPVTAMRRDPVTGIVSYHADACIGCRNCTVGCPYNVPQFEYDKAFGQIQKCQMCNQAGVERLDKGLTTACSDVCPTGATLFGSRTALLAEAKKRLRLKPGDVYNYPRGDVRSPYSYHEKIVEAVYQPHVWGETEAGGTNVMHVGAIPFDKMGMPPLGDRSAASVAEGVQHTLYKFMALPAVALAGLTYVVRRNTKEDEGGDL